MRSTHKVFLVGPSRALHSYRLLLFSFIFYSLCGHTARMPDETDAKKILTASLWTTGGDHQDALVLRVTWMKTIQQDLKSNNLSLNEETDVAQNRPLWRLMSTFGS